MSQEIFGIIKNFRRFIDNMKYKKAGVNQEVRDALKATERNIQRELSKIENSIRKQDEFFEHIKTNMEGFLRDIERSAQKMSEKK